MAEITEQVAASGDDGHTYSTTLVANVNYAFIGYDGTYTYNQFFRFNAVSIPVGVQILSAILQLKSYGNYSAGACNANIYFEDADNPSAPTTKAQYDGRSLTGAVAWSSIGSWSTDQWYDSPDITSILQTVIDRGGWAEDQAIIAYVKNNSSSSGAYRGAKTRDAGAAEGAKLVVTYGVAGSSSDGSKFGDIATVVLTSEKSLSDQAGLGDSIEGMSLTEILSDGAGLGDSIDGYNSTETITDAAGLGDTVTPQVDISLLLTDGVGLGDLTDAGLEFFGELVDAAGLGDSSDGFNWSAWIRANRDLAVIRYYCTLTGAADSTTDLLLPISSFSARKRTDESNYLSVVVPGYAYAEAIAARPNGELYIEMAYLIGGVESLREEIIRVDLEQINPQRGPRSRSITLIGHKAATYDPRSASIAGCNYTYSSGGSRGYRFPQADPYLNPGDQLTVEDLIESLTVDYITYAISARGAKFMEVRE